MSSRILTLLTLLLLPTTLAQRCQWATVRSATDLVIESLANPHAAPVSPFSNPVVVGGETSLDQDEEDWSRILAISPSRTPYLYNQNLKPIAPESEGSILSTPVREVRWRHSVVDQEVCAGVVRMVVVTEWSRGAEGEGKTYLLSAQVRFNTSATEPPVVHSLDLVVVGEGDWQTEDEEEGELSTSLVTQLGKEDWSALSRVRQDTRDGLIAVGNAYLDYYYGGKGNESENSGGEGPNLWEKPCSRLDGVVYTSVEEGEEAGDCGVVKTGGVTERRVLVDESVGAVSVLGRDGSLGGAASGWVFRVVEGRLRYVHQVAEVVG
ncbi:hypothetical protein VTJ49DRAFT_926 [Mycothermus thermophilus]|uniref:DUF8021 domain-containing protein n=1 Tax=Humicola insolens TaxID=85995 RepID=A0ABR3VDS2_HUMIN